MALSSTTFFGREAYRLFNDQLSITIVPALSGRVMELIVGGRNLFWINEPLLESKTGGEADFGGWKNWGGYKTWLAPQSHWPDPEAQPDDMDNVEWDVAAQTEDSLDLRGPVIPWSGVRLGRRIALKTPGVFETPGVSISETILNASAQPQTWAVWAVAQFPVPGGATFPSKDSKRVKTLRASPPRLDQGRLRFSGNSKWKVGALGVEGWGEYRADGWPQTFRAVFPAHPTLPHPDDCNLEAWSNSDPDYMELEWLGPIVALKSGEEWTFETTWIISQPLTETPPYLSPQTGICSPHCPA